MPHRIARPIAAVDNSHGSRRRCVTLFAGVIAIEVDTTCSTRGSTCRAATHCPSGARLIPRAPDAVQIGTDPPRVVSWSCSAARVACSILAALDGASTGRSGADHPRRRPAGVERAAGPTAGGRAAGPVEQVGRDSADVARRAPDRRTIGLAHRHGQAAASRILQARDDALVVVRGRLWWRTSIPGASLSPRPASGICTTTPDRSRRTLRPHTGGTVPPGPSATRQRAAGDASRPCGSIRRPPTNIRRSWCWPATRCPIWAWPRPGRSSGSRIWRCRRAGRAVVGPLVLPGRSSCLSCAHRHRTDADPGWPAVARQLARRSPRAPVVLRDAPPAWPSVRCSTTSTASCRRARSTAPWNGGPATVARAAGPGRSTRTAAAAAIRLSGARRRSSHRAARRDRARRAPAGRRPPARLCHNGRVADIPRGALSRTARLASLPTVRGRAGHPRASGSAWSAGTATRSPANCSAARPSRSSRCSARSRAAR